MHTTLNINNLFFIARQTVLDDKLKDNFKQLTNSQRKTLAKIFKSYKTFRKDPNRPIKSVSQKAITDITNNLSGVGRKRKEGCWKNFKRFVLSLLGFRISTSSLQKQALQLPSHFSKHQTFTLKTTSEMGNEILLPDEGITRQLHVDWKRMQGNHLFLINDTWTEPLILNPDKLPYHYENMIPDELKVLVNHDKASIRRIAMLLTQGVYGSCLDKLMSEYPDKMFSNTSNIKYYFAESTLYTESPFKVLDLNSLEVVAQALLIQTIDLKNLDAPIILDVYSNL